MGNARSPQQKRLYKRVQSSLAGCPFDLVKRLLVAFGYVQRSKGSGSHFTFKKLGRPPITVPYRRPAVKEHYVRMVLEAIDADND